MSRSAYFFSAAVKTFLQAGVILSLSLARQAMIRAAARRDAFAEFFIVAHAGVTLFGGHFLGEGGLRGAQQGGGHQHRA